MPEPLPTQPGTANFLRRRLLRGLTILRGKVAQEGYLAALDQGTISLANFLATLILARSVSPTELGMYGVGFTCLRLARVVQEGLTIQPLNTFGAPMEAPEFRRYATPTSLIQLALAVASAAGIALLGWVLIRLGQDTIGPTLYHLGFAFLFWQLQEYIRRMLYTRGEVLKAVINSILANLVRILWMWVLVGKGQLSGVGGLHAIGWGALAALLPGLWYTRPYWTRTFNPLGETFRRNWKFGKWVTGGTLLNWLSVEFYPVATAGLVSFAAAGAYRAIQNLVAPVHLLLRATDTFLTPRAARVYHQNGMKGLSRLLRLTYWATGLPILGVLLTAVLFPRPILHFLYGDTYLEFSRALALMALFYALWYAYWPLQTAFKAINFSRPIFLSNLVAILAMFTLGIWAILQWGVFGTLLGQALNAAIVAAILWYAWARRRPESEP